LHGIIFAKLQLANARVALKLAQVSQCTIQLYCTNIVYLVNVLFSRQFNFAMKMISKKAKSSQPQKCRILPHVKQNLGRPRYTYYYRENQVANMFYIDVLSCRISWSNRNNVCRCQVVLQEPGY